MNKELLQQLMNLADKYAGTEDDSLSPKRLALETAIRAAIAQPATNPWDEHVAPQMAKLASRIATHNVAPPADQTLIAPAIPGIRGPRPFVALVAQSTSQWMMTAPDGNVSIASVIQLHSKKLTSIREAVDAAMQSKGTAK